MTQPLKLPALDLEKADIASNQNLAQYIDLMQRIKKHADNELKKVSQFLGDKQAEAIRVQRELCGPFGKVTVTLDNRFDLTQEVAKKVDWDQSELGALAKTIVDEWEEPVGDYLDIEYSVPENRYKNWPKSIQEKFEPARTVKPGTVTLKLVDNMEGK